MVSCSMYTCCAYEQFVCFMHNLSSLHLLSPLSPVSSCTVEKEPSQSSKQRQENIRHQRQVPQVRYGPSDHVSLHLQYSLARLRAHMYMYLCSQTIFFYKCRHCSKYIWAYTCPLYMWLQHISHTHYYMYMYMYVLPCAWTHVYRYNVRIDCVSVGSSIVGPAISPSPTTGSFGSGLS